MKPKTQHTPGPWTIVEETIDDNKPEFFIMPKRDGPRIVSGWVKCGRNPHESIANARLIAAAPELLSLLKDVLESEYIDHTGTLTPLLHAGDLRGMINKAIAKAEGRE